MEEKKREKRHNDCTTCSPSK